jgi:hypothetical protein
MLWQRAVEFLDKSAVVTEFHATGACPRLDLSRVRYSICKLSKVGKRKSNTW